MRILLFLKCIAGLDFTRRNFGKNSLLNSLINKEKNNENGRSIYLYGNIDTDVCIKLSAKLRSFEETKDPIHLHIQSFGGELLPTFNVIDTIDKLYSPVYSYVEGYCASAASLLSVCCKKRFMNKHSLLLIHQLSGNTEGTYNYMKQDMTNFDIYMNFAKEIYIENSKLNNETLNDLLKYDNKWLNSTECLKYGLIDSILL